MRRVSSLIQSHAALRRASGTPSPKLWGGRFDGDIDPLMDKYNKSIGFDQRMWEQDIRGSIMYSRALERAGLLTRHEQEVMERGLEQVRDEWASGAFELKPSDEDIHSANERRLTELVGSVGGKLHTGRSRNDQVATDVRLWLRDELRGVASDARNLVRAAVYCADQNIDAIMPGYTHLQRAQPVRFSHWLLSHAWAIRRDATRFEGIAKGADLCPLGSGAIAGHPYGLDREALARDLGFSGPTQNSMDSVSDRDVIVDTLFACTLTGTHMSRLAEDLVVYSTAEFGFIRVADAYSTGSSLMPQKRNPDALELLRGKSGNQLGHLVGLLATLKGTPSTYNKDLQEDKPHLFAAVDTARESLQIAAGVVGTMALNRDKMTAALSEEMLATDLADYLVRRGVPFRETHHVAGAAVKLAEERGVQLSDLSVPDLKELHPAFEEDVAAVWDYNASVESRASTGGTALSAVRAQLDDMNAWLSQQEDEPSARL